MICYMIGMDEGLDLVKICYRNIEIATNRIKYKLVKLLSVFV